MSKAANSKSSTLIKLIVYRWQMRNDHESRLLVIQHQDQPFLKATEPQKAVAIMMRHVMFNRQKRSLHLNQLSFRLVVPCGHKIHWLVFCQSVDDSHRWQPGIKCSDSRVHLLLLLLLLTDTNE